MSKTASLALTFDLLGRDLSASKAFSDVGTAAEKAGKHAEGFGNRVSSSMKLAGAALIGGGIIEGFKNLYDAAAESARIGRLTEAVIKSTGGAANITAGQVSSLATAISNKTGVDDEAIQSGENLLLTFTNVRNEVGKGNDIFSQATATITDMSVALGQDTSSSAIQLGKALNDPIKGVSALQRVGVSFTASQKEQIKTLVQSGKTLDAQKIILKELGTEFGGAAAAASSPLDKLKVTLGNVAEQIGGYLIPFVDKAAHFIMDDLLPGVQDLGPAFGVVSDFVGTLVQTGSGLLSFFNGLPTPIKLGTVAFGAFLLLQGPINGFFTNLSARLTGLATGMGIAVVEVGVFRAAVGGLVAALGGPVGIAIAVVTTALSFLVPWLNKSDDATGSLASAQQTYADVLSQANGLITENVRQSAAKAAQDSGLLNVADKLGISLSTVTDAITHQGGALDSTRAQLKAFIAEHTVLVDNGDAGLSTVLDGDAQSAQKALTALNKLAGTSGQTAKGQGQLARAVGGAATSADGATASAKQYAASLEDAKKSASDAKTQTDLFKLSLDLLTGQNVDLIQVEAALGGALAQATGAMKKNGGAVLDSAGALNTQSENGRTAANVLLDVRNSGNQLISTMIQQGKTQAEVTRTDARLRDSFIKTAQQMGIGRKAAIELANKILGIPKERLTNIKADVSQAKGAIDDLVSYGKRQFITVPAGVHISGGSGPGGTTLRNAAGGYISGPGSGTSDSIPSWLSNGEFVVKASETAKHLDLLHAINSGAMPGYASGGIVIPVGVGSTSGIKSALHEAAAQLLSLPGVGGAVERWRGIVDRVLSLLGQPTGYDNGVLSVIQSESGGNPNAINLTDSNYLAGHPSQGLMQTIPSTFYAYAGQFAGRGITDPLANIFAGVNYALQRYGPGFLASGGRHSSPGHYIGYDNGGWLKPGVTMAYNGTGKPERIRTAEQEAALNRPITVIAQFGEETIEARAVRVVEGALTGIIHRGQHNPGGHF